MKFYFHGYFLIKTADFETFEYFEPFGKPGWQQLNRKPVGDEADQKHWKSAEELLEMYSGNPVAGRTLIRALI